MLSTTPGMTGSNIAPPPLAWINSRAAATAPAVGDWACAATAATPDSAAPKSATNAQRKDDFRSMDCLLVFMPRRYASRPGRQ